MRLMPPRAAAPRQVSWLPVAELEGCVRRAAGGGLGSQLPVCLHC